MKRWSLFVVLCLIANIVLADEVELKIATIAPEGSLWVKHLREIDKEIRKKTKKRVKLKIYTGSRKGNENEIIEKINTFELDGALFLQSGMDKVVPEINLLKLPYFYANYESWKKGQKQFEKQFEKQFAKKNLQIFGWVDMGFTQIFTKQKIQTLHDFQNIQNWLYAEEPLVKECSNILELKGKEVEVENVLDALKNNQIQSVYASPYLLVAMRWHEQVKYCIDIPVSNVVGGLVIHKSAYESIPEKYRKDFKKIATKHMKLLNRTIERENKVAKSLLQNKYNMEYIAPDNTWLRKNKELGQKIAKQQLNILYSLQQLQELIQALK